jgi:hypothetical protein
MNAVDIEEVVGAYLNIRSERDRVLKEYEAADALLKADMSEIERLLLSMCNEMNVNSINTSQGTVIRKLTERYICKDWENLKKFVLENQAVEILEKRIHQGNFKQFMSEHEDDGLPPGVDVMREYNVSIRKSSN